MKKELLSPAGDMESLKAAVHAGADAVYVGGKKFGARKFAHNFDDDALKIAVDYAHLYGVKLYVTVNTMIYEDEMEDVLAYVSFLHEIYVDAVIVQDVGLIYEIRKCIPGMEIHASTQMHNYHEDGCKFLEDLGVKRVVLARELTLDEVSDISTTLEKEIFIHGAICISYSGQCLFSSLVMGRSGNRGECAGMCRLAYSLEEDGQIIGKDKYLLSPRELCTISRFRELMESDVTCFKIEGRMKSPAYVYLVTKIYRTLMDQFERGKPFGISKQEFEELEVLYNRKFTEGHLFGKKNSELMNIESPNHIGISLGKTLEVTKDKIKIQLTRDLHQHDGIRFVQNGEGMMVNFLYDEAGLLIREAPSGTCVVVDNKVGLTKNSEVLKTTDVLLLERLKHYPLRKISISMKFRAILNEALTLEVTDGEHVVSCSLGEGMKAVQRPTTQDEVYAHLEKLGNTPYRLEHADISISDGVFIPMRFVNELRRGAIDELTRRRISRKGVGGTTNYVPNPAVLTKKRVKLCCLVRTEEQLQVALTYPLFRIYVADFALYKKYVLDYPELYYRQDRVSHNQRIVSSSLITDLSGFAVTSHSVTDYYLNVANVSYLRYLEKKHIQCATISVEADVSSIESLASRNDTSVELELLVYGRVELMVMKHCPLHMFKSNGVGCGTCRKTCYLIDRNHEKYPFIMGCNLSHLFSSKREWFLKDELSSLLSSGIDYIRIEFFDEEGADVKNIIEKYQGILQN